MVKIQLIKMFPYRNKEQERDSENTGTDSAKSHIKRILRNVSFEKAFHFYERLGKPSGEAARSLIEFRDKMNVVTFQSLVFHLKRKDFENWISEVIGDSKLAEEIRKISIDDFDLKEKLYATISKRIRELERILSIKMAASEDFSFAPRFSRVEIPDIEQVI